MALRLQFITVIVKRADLARRRNLPLFMSTLNSSGGILLETSWYDRYLWCDTAMNLLDAHDIVSEWEERGLTPLVMRDGRSVWQDVSIAASGRGPLEPCDWLEFDPGQNVVWLKGTERGSIVGGFEQVKTERARLAQLEQQPEQPYATMYESRYPKDDYDDARAALSSAIEIARFLHIAEMVDRLKQRLHHITEVYNS